jgi:hypothetical protein
MTFEQVRQELRHDIRRGDRRILRTVGGETLTHLELRNVKNGDVETPLEIGRTGANTDEIAQAVTQGRVPITYKKMGKFKSVLREISRPAAPKGKIFIIEEYKTAS